MSIRLIDIEQAWCREISKMHEESNTQSLRDLILDYESRPSVKGEIVIVVAGKEPQGKVTREKNQSTNKYK